MQPEKTPKEIIEAARIAASIPAPIAPYCQGQTFDERLNIPLDRPYTPDEWNWIFETFTAMLEHPDYWIRERALDRLVKAIAQERRLGEKKQDFLPVATTQRLAPILGAIASLEPKTPGLLEEFCYRFRFNNFLINQENLTNFILSWLNELEENHQILSINPDTILAAKIYFKFYGYSWAEAGENLLTALDRADNLIRACAANQIGQLYCRESLDEWEFPQKEVNPDMPPIDWMMQFMRDKEIERPGIAGAFWQGIGGMFCELQQHYGTDIEIREWILDILCSSPSPEPFIRLFPCHLGFDAHERFSKDIEAIQRLMQSDRFDVAIAAATEEHYKIEAMEPLLMELGNCDEPEIVRLASWWLAYYYHQLQPKGAEMGYVELLSALPSIDLFLLFSRLKEDERESPYAAIVYPKDRNGWLSQKTALKWIDRIFPESIRGEPRPNFTGSKHYDRGFVGFQGTEEDAKRRRWRNVIIGYRSDTFWNPKQLLQLE